jgi:hypothetical protein
MSALGLLPRLTSMTEELPVQRVEVGFVGTPPVRAVQRASGVSEVEVTVRPCAALSSAAFSHSWRREPKRRRSSPDAMAADPTTEKE